jgi:hypothetical protein
MHRCSAVHALIVLAAVNVRGLHAAPHSEQAELGRDVDVAAITQRAVVPRAIQTFGFYSLAQLDGNTQCIAVTFQSTAGEKLHVH